MSERWQVEELIIGVAPSPQQQQQLCFEVLNIQLSDCLFK
jgi:hypothetical protein